MTRSPRSSDVHAGRRTSEAGIDAQDALPKRVPDGKLALRRQREAAALRANLRKRKDQAHARDGSKQE